MMRERERERERETERDRERKFYWKNVTDYNSITLHKHR